MIVLLLCWDSAGKIKLPRTSSDLQGLPLGSKSWTRSTANPGPDMPAHMSINRTPGCCGICNHRNINQGQAATDEYSPRMFTLHWRSMRSTISLRSKTALLTLCSPSALLRHIKSKQAPSGPQGSIRLSHFPRICSQKYRRPLVAQRRTDPSHQHA